MRPNPGMLSPGYGQWMQFGQLDRLRHPARWCGNYVAVRGTRAAGRAALDKDGPGAFCWPLVNMNLPRREHPPRGFPLAAVGLSRRHGVASRTRLKPKPVSQARP